MGTPDSLPGHDFEGFSRVGPLIGHGKDPISHSTKILKENSPFLKKCSLFSLFY